MGGRLTIPVPGALGPVVEAIAAEGGRALLVGGYVRDHLLAPGHGSKDADVEVFGMPLEDVLRYGGEAGSRGIGGVGPILPWPGPGEPLIGRGWLPRVAPAPPGRGQAQTSR